MKRLLTVLLLAFLTAAPAHAQDAARGAADVLRLLLPFAMQGSPAEQYRLGAMFESGQGVQKDLVQAAHWYRKAAEAGNADAQYRLALMYQSGQGVPQDFQAADTWMRAAAAQGHAEARERTRHRAEPSADTPRMIREAQMLLARLGFDPGPADGVAGVKTREAVRSYQRIKGMAVDGRVDEPVLAAMRHDAGAPGGGHPGMPPAGADGRDIALIVGIGDYLSYTDLPTAEADARAVSHSLRQAYDVDSRLLINPTREAFLDSLRDLLRGLSERDRFILYFAGHGFVDGWTGEGYWLARDSRPESIANWIAHDTVEALLHATAARHVLIIADSTFAGTAHRDLGRDPDTLAYARRMADKTAREALVSGTQAPDARGRGLLSPFARRLVEVIERRDRILSGVELLDALAPRDGRRHGGPVPALLDLPAAGHRDGADFVLVRPWN